MIVHPIPHTARYIPTGNMFSAPFTTCYNFGIAANQNQVVAELLSNSIYYIDNYSLAGNIAKEEYLSAMNVTPTMILKRRSDGQNIYENKITLPAFTEGQQAALFIVTKANKDAATLSLSGILNQTADLVGQSPIILTVTFSLYVMDDNSISREFLDKIDPSFSRRLNK